MSQYDRAVDTAERLIAKFGGSFELVRSSSTRDGIDGTLSNIVQFSDTVKAVVLPVRKMDDERYISDFVRGKLKKLLVAANGLSLAPQSGDSITIATENHEILTATRLSPDGATDIIFTCLARLT